LTTTVTTVTTVTVTTVTGLTAALGLLLTLTLIALLIGKEIATAAPGERSIRWRRTLNIGMVPLLVSFVVIVVVQVSLSL
jgi:hypothetical protein